jgi:uncharacterized membrane protein
MAKRKLVEKPVKSAPLSPKPAGSFSATRMSYYASNFPHPDHLERYEKLFPGAAEAVFTEFRKQAEHRQELEKLVVPQQLKNARAGIYVQAISHIASACATILTALHTPPWVPVSLALIYSLTVAFIYKYGKDKQSKSMANKR